MDRRRSERRKETDIHRVLHALWSAAVGTPGYIKKQWMALDAWVARFDRRRPGRDRRS